MNKPQNQESKELYQQLEIFRVKALQMRSQSIISGRSGSEKFRINEKLSIEELLTIETAMELFVTLRDEANKFFSGAKENDDYYAFKKICLKAIDEAKPKFEKYTDVKKVLGNIGLAILGLGVFYIGACVINKMVTGKFTFLKTDAEKKLNSLNKSLNKMNAPLKNVDSYWNKQWEKVFIKRGPAHATLDLLNQYSCSFICGKGTRLGQFFSGKWSRSYGDEVQDAVGYYSDFRGSHDYEDMTVESLLRAVKTKIGIDVALKPEDAFAKIIKVIEANTGINYESLSILDTPGSGVKTEI